MFTRIVLMAVIPAQAGIRTPDARIAGRDDISF
jgi:hypothetical protein